MRYISVLVALALAGCGSILPRDLALVRPPAPPGSDSTVAAPRHREAG